MDSMVLTTEEEILAIRRFDRWCRNNGLKEFKPHIGLPTAVCLSCNCHTCLERVYLMERDERLQHNRRVSSMNPTMTNDEVQNQTETSLVQADQMFQFLEVVEPIQGVESYTMWFALQNFHHTQATTFQKRLVVKALALIVAKQDELRLKADVKRMADEITNYSGEMLGNAMGETRNGLIEYLNYAYINANKKLRN